MIEAIVGRDFLPRGTGIVTRRETSKSTLKRPGKSRPFDFLHCENIGKIGTLFLFDSPANYHSEETIPCFDHEWNFFELCGAVA